jgi:hypothetical protein
MARKRGKKALYEVMSKARNKAGYGRTLGKMRPQKPVPAKEEVTNNKSGPDVGTSKAAARWRRKPRIVQFNVGRIEFSLPYPVGIALMLGLILLVLAAFRLGQIQNTAGGSASEPVENISRNIEPSVRANPAGRQEVLEMTERPVAADAQEETALAVTEKPKPVEPSAPEPMGNNVIVLVQFGARADLVPVQAHFAEHGIETEIVMDDGRYFLQTVNRYDNPGKPGTDGHEALQEIIRVGAEYKGKAPPGYETFAPHFFSDAYGKKVK